MDINVKKILFSFLICLAGLFIVDRCVGWGLSQVKSRVRSITGEASKIIYTLSECDQDIVILGSSRASHGFIPDSIIKWSSKDSINTLTAFNGAVDNQGVLCQICMAESILSRHEPKLLIIDVYDDEFRWGDQMRTRLERFAHFYDEDETIRAYLDDLGLAERIKMQSRMYRYNHKIFGLVSGFLDKTPLFDGYFPLHTVYSPVPGDSLNYIAGDIPVDDYTLDRFRAFLQKVQDRQYPVMIVSSPTYYDYESAQILSGVCDEYGVPYYDFSSHPLFRHDERFFKDPIHLNHQGAVAFTKEFCDTVLR